MSCAKGPNYDENQRRLRRRLGLARSGQRTYWRALPKDVSSNTKKFLNLPEMAPIREAFKLAEARVVLIRLETRRPQNQVPYHKYFCTFQFPHTGREFKISIDSRALAEAPTQAHEKTLKHLRRVQSMNDRLRQGAPSMRRIMR